MESMRISVLHPKAMKLLQDLAEMDLIAIQDTKESAFQSLLQNLRRQSETAPTLEEITAEVESVRTERYAYWNFMLHN